MKSPGLHISRPVILIGLSGSGKTSTGLLLARALAVPFVDTDAAIENREKRTISEIFASDGEPVFRAMERQAVIAAFASERLFVGSLGGGAFEQDGIREKVLAESTAVYLKCSIDRLVQRLRGVQDRPLLTENDLENRISEMLSNRKTHYEMAPLTIDTTALSPEQAAQHILEALKEIDRAD